MRSLFSEIGEYEAIGILWRKRKIAGDFKTDAVRIEEIDRFDEIMVGDADDLDIGFFQPFLPFLYFRDRADLHGEVVHP